MTTRPAPAEQDPGLSIIDFLSDGGFVHLCATLAELLGAPVRLLDAGGREILPSDDQRARWRFAEPGPDASALAAERAFTVPMRAAGRVIGWVHVGKSPATDGPMAGEIEKAVALIVDVADQVCDREIELRARLRELSATQRLSALLAAAESEDEVLGIALDSAIELLGLWAGSLVLFDQDGKRASLAPEERDVEHRVSRNLSEGWLSNPLPLSTDREFDKRALAGEVVAVPDLQRDARVQLKARAKAEGLACVLNAGMIFNGRPLGVIRLYGREVRAFTDAEQRVLRTIAHQASVAIGQARLLRHRQEERRLQRQLALASDVQRRMLPKSPPQNERLDLAASWEPSLELSGDFFDFIELDGEGRAEGARRIGMVVGDVVGKGIAAALLMSHVRASLLAHVSRDASPSQVLASVNDDLCRDSLPNEFVTLWFGVVDPESLELTYASAGHDPPLLLRAPTDEHGEEAIALRSNGMLAGVLPGQAFSEERRTLRAGDTLAMFTDGMTDARNFEEERYGRDRLVRSIVDAVHGSPEISAAQLVKEVVWGVRRFAGLAKMPDDQTIVAMRVRP
ncbi:MAG: SpoIIE family protein phosphatase [Phycisphaerales bacterium]|jgi:serine phosphatase RsbU (regulator of sigma subunit)